MLIDPDTSRARKSSRVLSLQSALASFPLLATANAAMNQTLARIWRYARGMRILGLYGESGSGKSLLAAFAHACSPRRDHPFVRVDLAATVESLAASELFGHVRGAFTDARDTRTGAIASAGGGTVHLDELNKAPPTIQNMLLGALDTGIVKHLGSDRQIQTSAGFVATTNVPLSKLYRDETMIPDLHFRLVHGQITIPPLRERPEDIPNLAYGMLARHCANDSDNIKCPAIPSPLMRAFLGYGWPGNLREMDGAIQRLYLDSDGSSSLKFRDWEDLRAEDNVPAAPEATLPNISDEAIDAALKKCDGKLQTAAKLLKVSRTSLGRRVGKLPPRASEDEGA
jgi:two-component system, NtrC family, response regulator HydG